MLCERIKSKTQTHHKDTPRQHSLKKILLLVHLLILSLFPCNKDSENLLQKKYVRNLWVLGNIWVYENFAQKKTYLFQRGGVPFPKLPPIFLAFLPRTKTVPPYRRTLQDVPACSRLLSARLAVKNPTY